MEVMMVFIGVFVVVFCATLILGAVRENIIPVSASLEYFRQQVANAKSDSVVVESGGAYLIKRGTEYLMIDEEVIDMATERAKWCEGRANALRFKDRNKAVERAKYFTAGARAYRKQIEEYERLAAAPERIVWP